MTPALVPERDKLFCHAVPIYADRGMMPRHSLIGAQLFCKAPLF